MYKADISPMAEEVLQQYIMSSLQEYGEDTANKIVDAYEQNLSLLENNPLVGCGRLEYIPRKYRVFPLWKHLWFVFQIYEETKVIKIEYIIDDRQNYGEFLR